MKTTAKFILSLLLIVLIAVSTTACNDEQLTMDNGQWTITLEVTDSEGIVTSHEITTTETTVGAALLAEGLIEGDVGEWGLMVTHVNGLRADFTEDGAWWAFYIDGEMAMAGVDSTNTEEGVVYAFIYTPA
jgi:hypothetical protein